MEHHQEAAVQSGEHPQAPAETAKVLIRQVKRRSRRRVSAEDKVRIVTEGLRGEESVTDLVRREGITKTAYYRWLKSFLEAGKLRLKGDHLRQANSDEVKELRKELASLKELTADGGVLSGARAGTRSRKRNELIFSR